MSANLCNVCSARPKCIEGNKTHPYCSKRCAANGNKASDMCSHCHKQPKYNDGTIIHPYCGKSCVQKAAAARVTQTPSRPRKDGCLLCGTSVKRGVFCSQACASKAENQAPLLLEVPNGHDKFQSVADQFKTSWRCQTPCPTVRRVYKVVCSRSSTNMYETYRDQVEARGNFVASGRSPGNENRRWHGTKRQCLLGDNGNTTLCSSSSCSLCGIIRNSYSLKLCRQGSFGAGIYTSSTSSKSNGYSSNGTHSNLKAILLNKVVVGRGHKMTYSGLGLTAPPSGYDSVLAEVLNDELICYTEDAIRPSYLVMYGA